MNGRRVYKATKRPNYEHESLITEARLDKGWTYRELAEKSNVRNEGTLSGLSTGLISPVRLKTGDIKPWVQRVCDALEVDPIDMFPRYFCRFSKEEDFTDDQLNSLLLSQYTYEQESVQDVMERRELVEESLLASKQLSPGMITIYFKWLLLDMSARELAEMYKISVTRVNQHIQSGKRKLPLKFHELRSRRGESHEY